jgi:hypothetical protein
MYPIRVFEHQSSESRDKVQLMCQGFVVDPYRL